MKFGEQMVNRVTSIFKCQAIAEVYNKSLSKLKIRSLLKHREDFWILKLQTISPQSLNISLNYSQDTIGSIW